MKLRLVLVQHESVHLECDLRKFCGDCELQVATLKVFQDIVFWLPNTMADF